MDARTYPAIPVAAGRVAGWKDLPIRKQGLVDPLVALGPLTQNHGNILTASVYFGEYGNSPYKAGNKLDGSLLTVFARRSVARRLEVAERLLPAGYHLIVFDAYRPYRVQQSLYAFYKRKLGEQRPDMDEAALTAETQKYVSFPSADPDRPSPHNTGGAVDLAIVRLDAASEEELLGLRKQLAGQVPGSAKRAELEARLSLVMRRSAKMLDFGTAFDHGGEKSALAYYEAWMAAGEKLDEQSLRACKHRRLLYDVMTRAGFQPYFAEWWHFNAPESQMGAAAAGLDYATFGAMKLDADNLAHERARLKLHREMPVPTSGPALADDWPTEVCAPPEV